MNEESAKRMAKTPPVQKQGREEGRENLDKVRDLLFGPQKRTFDSKITRMEDRLLREIGDVRTEVKSRLDSLETFVKNEFKTIVDRITSEKEDRTESDKQLKADIQSTVETFGKKASQLEDKVEASAKDLREQLLGQTKRLTDEMVRKHEEALRVTEESTNRIRDEYVDRSNLSRMFTDVAVTLNTSLAEQMISAQEESGDE
ncbi:hypothetical protein ACFL2Q_03500 [Thermodesulfobacteriota bacterium]